MFILALTILGLSLFALSSYEGQYMNRSLDSDQALYTAESGIEHAKFVLARKGRLEDVGSGPYFPSGVVYVSAHRTDGVDPDSVGPVPLNVPIRISVIASVESQSRMIEALVT